MIATRTCLRSYPDTRAICLGSFNSERHTDFALSTLSCEALVVAERLDASICVWLGDDGPNLRAASQALGIAYRTIVNGP